MGAASLAWNAMTGVPNEMHSGRGAMTSSPIALAHPSVTFLEGDKHQRLLATDLSAHR